MLAVLAARRTNLLLLDEPTNAWTSAIEQSTRAVRLRRYYVRDRDA